MLILIAHGSRDARWRASVEQVVASIGMPTVRETVRLAYMDFAPPTLLDVAREAVRCGERSLRVLPLFLAQEGHVERDVKPLVEAVRAALDGVEITLLAPFGQHTEFREALARIADRTDEGGMAP
ncbi:MAG TPA: CbiX/SirB N-terminal domain-containing protein [Longimicrobiales bacterium]|nr:CbiX/SirB N-terminal domain-containing protein [Longimicrobiales bacterium]